jgi:hypothetical protein
VHWSQGEGVTRHAEVLAAVAKHGSARRAAVALGIHPRTVEKHVADERLRVEMGGAVAGPAAIEPAPLKPHRRIVAIPDLHAPYHDEAAYELVIRTIGKLKPNTIVVIGDFADCFSISSFPKSPERRNSLKWEVEETAKCLRRLEGLSDDRHFCEGNHEERLERYLCQRAPELYGLVTMRDLLGTDKHGWSWVPYRSWVTIGKTTFGHEFAHFGKYCMQQSLASFGHSVVFGHSHRGGTHYEGTIDGERRYAMNIGWLGDPAKADYMHRAQTRAWQQGIGVVDQDEHGNSWAQFVPIVAGRMMIGGELFS